MRVLLTIFCLFSFVTSVNAQCVPDTSITHNDVGIYPDSVTGLPHAITGQPYSTVIQFKVGIDTTFTDPLTGLTLPAVITSINIDTVFGLPAGFTYSCTPSNCSFPGGSDGCILITGPAPTVPMIGFYPIVVQLEAFGTVFGTPQSIVQNITSYSITIDSTTGIGSLKNYSFSIGQNQPNPSHSITTIPVSLLRAEHLTITVTNLIGEKVMQLKQSLPRGNHVVSLDVHNLQPGIYMYSVSNGSKSLTRRMIITDSR